MDITESNNSAMNYAHSMGLKVRTMHPATALDMSNAALAANKAHGNGVTPTIEQLHLVRITDIFPTFGTMQPVTQGIRVSHQNDSYFINRIVADTAKSYNITQRDGSPVLCSKDLNNADLTPEFVDYCKSLNQPSSNPIDALQSCATDIALSDFSIPYKSQRETVHFTMNSLVSANDGGSWDNLPFIFIEPYLPHHGKFENLAPYDTWIRGEIKFQSPTLLIRPDHLNQLLSMAEKDLGIMATLIKCDIVIMNPNTSTRDLDYVNAILHEKGAPAYVCLDKNIAIDKDQRGISATNFTTFTQNLAKELTANGTPTEHTLHSNTTMSSIENRQATCSRYESTVKFARFLANKTNNEELSNKIKPLEELDTLDKVYAYFEEYHYGKAADEFFAMSDSDPNKDRAFGHMMYLENILYKSDKDMIKEADVKSIMRSSVFNMITPILDELSPVEVHSLLVEYEHELLTEQEATCTSVVKLPSDVAIIPTDDTPSNE